MQDQDSPLVLPAAALPARPAVLATTLLATGDGPARLVERRFGPHLEDEGAFAPDGDVERLRPERPPLTLVPVTTLGDAAALGAIVWTDGSSLCVQARLGLAPATQPLAPELRATLAWPALETPDHAVRVYAIRDDRGSAELLEYHFGAPIVAVIPPDPAVPDDWDDEEELPGPARMRPIGPLPRPPHGRPAATLASTPAGDELRLVYLARTDAGLSLEHVVVRDGRIAAQSAAPLPGTVPLPDAAPVVHVDARGQSVVAALVARTRTMGSGRNLEVVLVTARFAADAAPSLELRPIDRLAAPPRSTALAWSWIASERPFCRAALLLADGTIHEGDVQDPLERAACAGVPLVPLVLGTTSVRGYLAVESPSGPTLALLVPRP